jgi:hypothetical protein
MIAPTASSMPSEMGKSLAKRFSVAMGEHTKGNVRAHQRGSYCVDGAVIASRHDRVRGHLDGLLPGLVHLGPATVQQDARFDIRRSQNTFQCVRRGALVTSARRYRHRQVEQSDNASVLRESKLLLATRKRTPSLYLRRLAEASIEEKRFNHRRAVELYQLT